MRQLSPEEARDLVAAGAQLVDVRVRRRVGWRARIGGASHIELGELSARAGEIERERAGRLLLPGRRTASDMAAAAFEADGYEAAVLAGGIEAWAGAGLPLEPGDGYVAESGEAASILKRQEKVAPRALSE